MSDLDDVLAELAVVPVGDAAGLAVDADLLVELTTVTGASTTVRVTGRGQQVRVDTERPEAPADDREDRIRALRDPLRS